MSKSPRDVTAEEWNSNKRIKLATSPFQDPSLLAARIDELNARTQELEAEISRLRKQLTKRGDKE